MTDSAHHQTTIEQTVRIAASPEMLWSFWTDPERLCEWWGKTAEVVAEPGGLFRVVLGDGVVMRGAFTELDPPNRLVFTFGWESNAAGEALAPGLTQVEVTFTPEAAGTILVLRHRDMPVSHAADHEKGWAYFVGERLAAVGAAAGRAR